MYFVASTTNVVHPVVGLKEVAIFDQFNALREDINLMFDNFVLSWMKNRIAATAFTFVT